MLQLSGLKEAWEEFVENESTDEKLLEKIDPLIARSWKRSRQLSINPLRVYNNGIIKGWELEEKIGKNEDLIHAAIIEMTNLYYNLSDDISTNISLADADGLILKNVSSPYMLKRTEKVKLFEGANWSEEYRGTNAIGLAMIEKKSVSVKACQHFIKELHPFTSFAVPLYGPDSKLMGVFNITVLNEEAYSYLMSMALSTTRAIENRMLYLNSLNKLRFSSRLISELSNRIDGGLIAIDDSFKIVLLNKEAAGVLGCNPQEFIGLGIDSLIGKKERSNFNKMLLEDNKNISIQIKSNDKILKISKLAKESQSNELILFNVNEVEDKVKQKIDEIDETEEISEGFRPLLTKNKTFKQVIKMGMKVSKTDSTVLIEGETGTGKELFAKGIHYDQNSTGAFVPVNCGAIPRELIESELFGYVEGAFTGAKKGGAPGKFELAHNGTIFLDEIAEMPLTAQVALLRVLEEREVVRVGGSQVIPVNLRVIAATNKDLRKEAESGNFRKDLYYRLNVVRIRIPPLRERKEDVIYLAEYFIVKLSKRWKISPAIISPQAQHLLTNYFWPGNVRELKSTMERALSMADEEVILPEHLLEEIREYNRDLESTGDKNTLREAELERIKATVKDCDGNITQAAKVLGVSRNTIYRKLNQVKK